MSTFSIPSLSSDSDASSLASTLGGMGIPFTLSPSTSGGYSLETDSANSSTVQSMLNSAGLLGSSYNGGAAAAPDYGNVAGAPSTGTTNAQTSSSGLWDQFTSWISSESYNGIAILVGIVFVAVAVFGMVGKSDAAVLLA